jgi:hypothetical protein
MKKLDMPFVSLSDSLPSNVKKQLLDVLSVLSSLKLGFISDKTEQFIISIIADCIKSCITGYVFVKEYSIEYGRESLASQTKIVLQSDRYKITIEENKSIGDR